MYILQNGKKPSGEDQYLRPMHTLVVYVVYVVNEANDQVEAGRGRMKHRPFKSLMWHFYQRSISIFHNIYPSSKHFSTVAWKATTYLYRNHS